MSKSWFSMKAAGDEATISIHSEIGGFGISTANFRDALTALGNPKTLNISLDSIGGDVTTGFAIYNMLNRHPAHKVVRVEGIAASMGSVIAMAGNEVEMPENAMLMIHNPVGSIHGQADELASFADALRVMQDNIANTYVQRTGLKRKDVLAMMDKETWLSAREAVKLGFADRVEKPQQMAAKHDLSKFTKVPGALAKANAAVAASVTDISDSTEEESPMTLTPEEKAKAEKDIRDSILAKHKDIRALCSIAGKPELADGYIAEDKSVPEVTADLAAKAEAAAAEAAKVKGKGGKDGKGAQAAAGADVSARHSVDAEEREPVVIDTTEIYANWNKSGARG